MSLKLRQVPSIDRSSAPEQVATAVTDMIMRGEVGPGEPLPETALADAFGVSRNTIRETIRILERDGLVRHQRHRGAVVAELTEEDVKQVYQVRRILELGAIDRVKNGVDLDGLGQALEAFEATAEGKQWDEIVQADAAFHAAMVGLLQSERIDMFFQSILNELRFALAILSLVDAEFRDPAPIIAEHRAVYDALVDRRVAEARKLALRHLDANERRLIEIIVARAADKASGSPEKQPLPDVD